MNITTYGHPGERDRSHDEEEDDEAAPALYDIFQEPDGFYEKEGSPKFQHFKLSLPQRNPEEVAFSVRLVAQSPLWGHLLFPAGRYLAEYLAQHATALVHGKAILELGAGSGLPSLVCAYCEANAVVLTDYPDANLLENLRYNLEHCGVLSREQKARVKVVGHVWGSDTDSLLAQISSLKEDKDNAAQPPRRFFDTLILADLVFNHSEHARLVATVRQCLAYTREARALVFFTPHRPWLFDADLRFFDVATQPAVHASGETGIDRMLGVRKIVEDEQDKWTMFEEDKTRDRAEHPGDEKLRRTVFGYELFWRDLQ